MAIPETVSSTRPSDPAVAQHNGRTTPPPPSDKNKPKHFRSGRKWLIVTFLIIAVMGVYLWWKSLQPAKLPDGIASSNGRVEATEIDVAAKLAGRVKEMLVNEGDYVARGQAVARMDTEVLTAQLREAEADLRKAKSAVETARINITQRESEKAAGLSLVTQRESEKAAGLSRVAQHDAELELARRQRDRLEKATTGVSTDELDTAKAKFYAADATQKAAKANVAAFDAGIKAAQANVASSDAAIATAQSQVIEAEANVDAAKSRIQRIQADIDDSTLKAPRDGRVQYRIAQAGEVLPAGGKVLNMVDLTDVYMTFFLPTESAGRVKMGAETHLVLDALPQFVIPAKVTFVADVAQFTPKTVETTEERQKLTFRIKAHIPQDLLEKYVRDVKTGLPGIAYVQVDPHAEWPERLRVSLSGQSSSDPTPKSGSPKGNLP